MRPVLASLLLAASAAHADLPKNLVLADLGLHVVGLGYQRTLTPNLAAQVSVNLWLPWTQNQNFLGLAGTDDKGNVSGLVARARVFLYPEGQAPIGAWLSPFVQGGFTAEQAPTWAAGAAVGWAWLFVQRIHLALGLGVQYHRGPTFARPYFHADINLGFAF